MTFLSALFASIAEKFLAFFWGKIAADVKEKQQQDAANAASAAASAVVLKQTQDAQTKEERDDAAKNTISHF